MLVIKMCEFFNYCVFVRYLPLFVVFFCKYVYKPEITNLRTYSVTVSSDSTP